MISNNCNVSTRSNNYTSNKPTSSSITSETTGLIIKNRWILKQKLGQGGFGIIFAALDLNSMKPLALKFESANAKKQTLKIEAYVLKKLHETKTSDSRTSSFHICKYYGCDCNVSSCNCSPANYNFIAMQLLGRNLFDLRKKSAKFSQSTCALLLCQMVTAIQQLHQCGYIHRDIKPSNFAIGYDCISEKGPFVGKHKCYMIDFGLCRRFLTTSGAVRLARKSVGFKGTVRYASLNAHDHKDLSRRDDLWSLFYIMVEFLTGSLPWKKEKDKVKVAEMKREVSPAKLIQNLPEPCHRILEHLESIQYEDAPDYDLIFNQFLILYETSGDSPSLPCDWDKVNIAAGFKSEVVSSSFTVHPEAQPSKDNGNSPSSFDELNGRSCKGGSSSTSFIPTPPPGKATDSKTVFQGRIVKLKGLKESKEYRIE